MYTSRFVSCASSCRMNLLTTREMIFLRQTVDARPHRQAGLRNSGREQSVDCLDVVALASLRRGSRTPHAPCRRCRWYWGLVTTSIINWRNRSACRNGRSTRRGPLPATGCYRRYSGWAFVSRRAATRCSATAPVDSVGQQPALVEADVAGRADQPRDGAAFMYSGTSEADEFTGLEQAASGAAASVLPTLVRAREQEQLIGFGVAQAGAGELRFRPGQHGDRRRATRFSVSS